MSKLQCSIHQTLHHIHQSSSEGSQHSSEFRWRYLRYVDGLGMCPIYLVLGTCHRRRVIGRSLPKLFVNVNAKQVYTTITEGSKLETFAGLSKIFHTGGGYQNPFRTRETTSTNRLLALWPLFLSAKKSSPREQGCAWFLRPATSHTEHTRNSNQLEICERDRACVQKCIVEAHLLTHGKTS